jgi:hypothetical protein
MTMQRREVSLSSSDLDVVQNSEIICQDPIPVMSYRDQHGIFEVMYQDAEVQDEINQQRRGRAASRRVSMHAMSSQKNATCINVHRHIRCHSSFNPRNRQAHRDAHYQLEEYFLEQGNIQRSSLVSTLLDFHSSFELSIAAGMHDISPSLHFSCPVLSYMHDSDEDSVEMSMAKRSSLMLVTNGNESIESLNYNSDNTEGVLIDSEEPRLETEYVIEMSEDSKAFNLQPEKRRKRPSYITLERRLSTESHLAVLKSLIVGDNEDLSTEPENEASNTEPTIYLDTCITDSLQDLSEPGETTQLSIARMA